MGQTGRKADGLKAVKHRRAASHRWKTSGSTGSRHEARPEENRNTELNITEHKQRRDGPDISPKHSNKAAK